MSDKSFASSSSIGMNGTVAAALVVSGAALGSATDAKADLVITPLGGEQFSIGDIGSFTFDLNGDGFDDFIIEGFGVKDQFGARIGTTDFPFLDVDGPAVATVGELNPFFGGVFVAGDSFFAETFLPGDIVGGPEGDFFLAPGADLFFGSSGPFAEPGTGFIGLALLPRILEDPPQNQDPPQEPDFDIFFGFAEITRGSITLNSIGFQNTANTGAQIPSPVPLPATLGLLAAGYGGLLALRRRKRSKA